MRAVGCVFAAWVIVAASITLATEKNVVVVVADDLGCEATAYGSTWIEMPHLNSLTQDATTMTHAFCTTASCSASRSVMLSGMHNHANGMYGLAHAEHHFSSFDRLDTLSARLSKAGYRTGLVGKYHVTPEAVYPFEVMIPGNSRNGVQMADNCRQFLVADRDRPFFLWFATADPHRGRGVGPKPLTPNRFGNEDQHRGIQERVYNPDEVVVPAYLPDTPTVRAELAEYAQSCSRFDQGLGRLIEVIKETGNWDNTLLIVISDNGPAFHGAKTTLYEPGMRLPCIVRNPYQKSRPATCHAMITWVDLAPTILEFAGTTDGRPKMQGRSFLAALAEERPAGWDEVYASHTFHEVTMYYPMRVVRGRRYKLIWNIAHQLTYSSASDLYNGATWQEAIAKGLDSKYGQRTVGQYLHRPEFELYDLENDPNETTNLAGESEQATRLDELKAKLKDFQQRTGDPWVHKWVYQ
jgi:N-sulfoglucosamine sulfohydrolase